MGNTHEKLIKQLEATNKQSSSEKFYNVSGIRLNFAFVSSKPNNILKKIVWDPSDYFVQISSINPDQNLESLIGTTSIDRFIRISNIISHLISFSTTTTDLDEESLCSICLENPADTILGCGHPFCSKDLQSWASKNQECPLCRQVFEEQKSFVRIDDFNGEVCDEVKICKELIFSLIDF
ncbi:hypothetical protein SteCoe_9307 [Stentor coeruleus]|uniref:RING-type domain-containing protein n=1 Tax=Stentor coeruleus TaxID=5963 RepID=A0A1R2CI60_9CILI|nr:hypothetical protein SteCoe_9307 [Stentor coeruleus]